LFQKNLSPLFPLPTVCADYNDGSSRPSNACMCMISQH
jgi:hypothetical protein